MLKNPKYSYYAPALLVLTLLIGCVHVTEPVFGGGVLVDSSFINYTVNGKNIHLPDYVSGEKLPTIFGTFVDSIFSIDGEDSIFFLVRNNTFALCSRPLNEPFDALVVNGTIQPQPTIKIGAALIRTSDGSLWTTDSAHTGIFNISKADVTHYISGTFSFTAIKVGAKSPADTIRIENGVMTNVEIGN
jgi:hypothetical protein